MQNQVPDLININVTICDRPYPMKIRPEEEEAVRKSAKLINEKIRSFQNSYAAKDKQDYLAMCALFYVVEHLNLKQKSSESGQGMEEGLQELDEMITKAIGS
jgi:cell division protein ZapA